MKRNLIRRGLIAVALLAVFALLTVRKESAGSSAAPGDKRTGTAQGSSKVVPHRPLMFSPVYEYCYTDSEGRPTIVRRKRRVFFLPESPPNVDDRTFIEGEECR